MQESTGSDRAKRFRTYAIMTAALIVIAALSFLLVPQGNSLGSCDRLVFASNRYACITSLALSQNNVSLCGYASGAYADSCYSQVAQQTGNESACGSISNGTTLGLCVAAIASANDDYQGCASAGEPYASSCQADVAVKLDNESLCTGIGNSTYATVCASVIGIRKAQLTENASYCGLVTASIDRNLTSYIILNASAGTSTASVQGSFALGSLPFQQNATYTARDYCYISLAAETANGTLCGKVTAGAATDACISQATAAANYTASGNESLSSLLSACASTGAYAQQCQESVILSQAINTMNATLCSQLASGQADACYTLLASTYANSSYCGYISNAGERSNCTAGS
ncbi:MAG: hypothetical protein KGI04_01205 [Candidatus Micrarchaeota archaeon]|nr:hypothetical protein [Candidatus Micrarchaeota archaeon]